MPDILIRGGTVIDGTGRPARRADVAIAGDRIEAIDLLPGAGAARKRSERGPLRRYFFSFFGFFFSFCMLLPLATCSPPPPTRSVV